MIRRIELLAVAIVLVVAAFSTGLPFLFYLLYLAILVGGGSYVLTRLGLSDLEAGYAVGQLQGHVGEQLRVTYTLRNAGRLPKPWLEVHNPTSLPVAIPGGRSRSGHRGRAELDRQGPAHPARPLPDRAAPGPDRRPVRLLRGFGDGRPGGHPDRLPADRATAAVAAARREPRGQPCGARADAPDEPARDHRPAVCPGRQHEPDPLEVDGAPRRDPGQGVRPRADGRRLDLPRPRSAVQAGSGEESTAEIAIRAAASIADRSLTENRAVGLTAFGHRMSVLPADRGGRQHLKIMQLLAAVDADGAAPFVEGLVTGLARLRRGMTAVVITSSLDRGWIRPLAGLRARGVACVVLSVDAGERP